MLALEQVCIGFITIASLDICKPAATSVGRLSLARLVSGSPWSYPDPLLGPTELDHVDLPGRG